MYDMKCYELAKVWLQPKGWDHDVTIARLAQHIQDTIEDFEHDLMNAYEADSRKR
jgi:hypothetical protein